MKNTTFLLSALFFLSTQSHAQIDTVRAHCDTTWRTQPDTTAPLGWEQPAFNDNTWGHSVISPFIGGAGSCATSQAFTTNHFPYSDMLMWRDSANGTLPIAFRKHINLPHKQIQTAIIDAAADDHLFIYINGVLLNHNNGSLLVGPTDSPTHYPTDSVAHLLHVGDNVIGLSAQDNGGFCRWIYFNISVTLEGNPTGLNDKDLTPLAYIAPNPTKGIFTVHAAAAMDQVIITDLIGHEVSTIPTHATDLQIDLSNQVPGIYFAQVYIGGRYSVIRLVKE